MSNKNVNETGTSCEESVYGKTCSLDKLQVKRNTNNNEEFASEFHSDLQTQNPYTNSSASEKFKPNQQQMPVSERTAWN